MPMVLRKEFFMNFKEEFALSTPHDVTEVRRRRLMILVMLGNIIGHALLSAMVLDRESGLLFWQLHKCCQSLTANLPYNTWASLQMFLVPSGQ